MPTVAEHAKILRLPIDEMVKLSEAAAANSTTVQYQSLEMRIMQKLAACRKAEEVERGKQQQRVYIQHAVENADRAVLRQAFPKWDIKFSGVDPRANAKAHAIYYLMAQFLLDKLNQKKGPVLAYGVSLKQVIMRNRKWMHVCIPGQDVVEQGEFKRDDRAIIVMAKSLEKSGKTYELAREYAEGRSDCYCGDPRTCKRQATAAIMMLHKTNTNFRQVAYYMQQHGVKLLYFAIPASKHMEFASAGHLPDLGAYVFPTQVGSKTQVNVTYTGDVSLGVSYDHENYLELVGRTSVVLGDTCYHKEHVTQVLGVHVYKVTAFDKSLVDPKMPSYYSWNEPQYKKLYVVRVPLLKPQGSMYNRQDWEMYTFNVERDVVDSTADWAMRADGVQDMAKAIERRLSAKLSRVAGHGQVIPVNSYMAVDEFDLTSLVIFVTVFMKKYVQGRTVSVVAPHARALASLSRAGFFTLARHFIMAKTASVGGWFSQFATELNGMLFESERSHELPLPSFMAAMGYTEYDNAAYNPLHQGWLSSSNPVDGFSPSLPGVKPKVFDVVDADASDTSSVMSYTAATQLLIDGEAVLGADGRLNVTSTGISRRVADPPPTSISKIVAWMFPFSGHGSLTTPSVCSEDDGHDVTDSESSRSAFENVHVLPYAETVSSTMSDTDLQTQLRATEIPPSGNADFQGTPARYEMMQPMQRRHKSYDPKVTELVDRIYTDTGMISTLADHEILETAMFDKGKVPAIVKGAVSDAPAEDLRDALNIIFPGATTMNTAFFESDKQFADYNIRIKGTKLALDMSKMGVLRPEAFYKPLVRSHVVPDAKNSHVDTLWTVAKRYANTPADADPLSVEAVFSISWNASLQVYYREGTEEFLRDQPYIGPDSEYIRAWVSNLEPEKRDRLMNAPGDFIREFFSFSLQNNQFMIKGKVKPDLTSTYMSSLKMPQGIQYDASGKSVAVYTPIYSQKVDREQSVLRSNVLIMQRKNYDQVNEFLNRFDWRPDSRGSRRYIEIDYSEYDKSQGTMARSMHWLKAEKFKMLPEFLEYFKNHTSERTVSAMRAGIKTWLSEGSPSGLSNTLDGNTDVSMMSIAELLLPILDQIEFIMVMGDDVTIAVRGTVDISGWEAEVNRKFNLTMKVAVHEHGYFCSMDIVHFPSGHARVVADIVKRALAFTQQSVKDVSAFDEKFMSYRDSLDGIQDKQVQLYLQVALPLRYEHILPGLNQESVKLLCKVHAAVREDLEHFKAFFASAPTTMFY